MGKKRSRRVLQSDEDLASKAKQGTHTRREGLLNMGCLVLKAAMVGIPVILTILFLILVGHFLWIGDWEAFTKTISVVGGYFITYFLGFISKETLGLGKDK